MTIPAFIRYLVEMPRPSGGLAEHRVHFRLLFCCCCKTQTKGAGLMLRTRKAITTCYALLRVFMQCLKDATSVGQTAVRQWKKKQIDKKIDRSGWSSAFIWSCWQYLNKTPFLDDSRSKASPNNHQVKEKTWNFQSWDSVLFWYRRYRYSVLENGSFGFGFSVLS